MFGDPTFAEQLLTLARTSEKPCSVERKISQHGLCDSLSEFTVR